MPDPFPIAKDGSTDPSQNSQIAGELLMSRLDSVGLDVMGTQWSAPSPGKLLLSEVVWSQLWAALQGQTRRVTRRIHRVYVRAVEELATGALWCAAQLSV